MTPENDSTFSTWQNIVRKFLQKDKRLRTGIISTSTGLSGVEVSKDHSTEQLTTLTALLGAFYSNMVEIREILWKQDANISSSRVSSETMSSGFLEIGLGYIFTKNGSSYKHFVSLTNAKEFPDQAKLTAFLAARGRDKIEMFNNWLKLYFEVAPLILEMESQDGWRLPSWNFNELGHSTPDVRFPLEITSRFWMGDTIRSQEEKILRYAYLLILALEDMLSFKGTQGLWFEHHLLTLDGSVHPQYFVFLFPEKKTNGSSDFDDNEEQARSFISAPLQVVFPLAFLPKCRVFFQLLVNLHPIPEQLEQQFFSLVKRWNLDSDQSRNQVAELLEFSRTRKGFMRDLDSIASTLYKLRL